MRRAPLPSVEPCDPLVYATVGCRSYDGGDYHVQKEVILLEILFKGESGAYLGKHLARGRAFKVEYPHGVSAVKDADSGRIVNGVKGAVVYQAAVVFRDHGYSVPYNGEASVSQKVNLDKAPVFNRILVPLEHLEALCGYLHGAVASYVVRNHNHSAAVGGEVSEMSLKPGCGPDDLPPWPVEIGSPHSGMIKYPFPHLAHTPAVAHLTCNTADFLFRKAEYLGDLPHRGSGPEGVVVGHHGRPPRSIGGKDVIKYRIPLIPGKIHINVRRVHPSGIKEPLKEKIVPYWIHLGNPQGVSGDGGRCASPSTRHSGPLSDIRHHKKIVGEALFPDDCHLMVNPCPYLGGDGAVAPYAALIYGLKKGFKGGFVVHAGKARKYYPSKVPVLETHVGYQDGVFKGLGRVREPILHKGGGSQKVLLRAGIPHLQARKLGIQGNRPQDAMKRKVLPCCHIDPVCRNRRNPGFSGKGIGPRHVETGRKLQVEVFAALAGKGLYDMRIIRYHYKAPSLIPQGVCKIKILPAAAIRYEPAEVSVAFKVLYKGNGPSSPCLEFASQYG